MLEGIQILIDRMEMFPDEFRKGGNLNDFLYILEDIESRLSTTEYYKSILTEEEIATYKQATLKFHRENFNRKVIEVVMQGQRSNKLTREPITITASGVGGGGSGTYVTSSNNTIGGGAFTTKTGALFTPANTPKKKK